MNLSNIITQLKGIIESVEGIGKVHDYDRWTVDWNTLLNLFTDANKRINGWVITSPRSDEQVQAAGAVNIRTHLIKIEGVYGLKDSAESEKAFRDLLERICDKLRENNSLNGSCLKSSPPRVARVIRRRFSGVLAHVGEIQLSVAEYIQYTPV